MDTASVRAGLRRLTCALLAVGLTAAGCGGGGWVADYPDIAARAAAAPAGFVGPALAQWESAEGISGSYSMRVSKGIGRSSVDLQIRVRRPGDIDMAVLAPTGAMQAYLRVNRVEVGLSFLEDRAVYRGPASRYAFEQALGFDLSAADAAALLLGYGIADGEADGATTFWDAEARRIRVETRSGTLAWLHPQTQRFDRLERQDRRGRVTAEITDWLAAPAPLPRMLTLEIEPDGYGIRLELLGTPSLNPDFPDGFFDVDVPPGFVVRPLSDLAEEGGLFRRAAPAEDETQP